MRFSIKLIDIQNKEIFIGVFVSSFAKNGITKIFIIMKAGKPQHNAISAELVAWTSLYSNAPLKNRNEIMFSEKINNPKKAGIENKIPNFIAFEILFSASFFCFFLTWDDKTGNNAVPIAIPSTPKGSWFTLSA